MHIISWNVNGLRSIVKKNFFNDVKTMEPDILCLQETKASVEEVVLALQSLPGYHLQVNACKGRKGYSGTAILSKTQPLSLTCDMNMEAHDQEGRVITAEYSDFYLVTVYVPNSGDGLKRLDYRQQWDLDFIRYLAALKSRKPVLVAGDLNVAHHEIDLARPKQNYNKSAGYTQEEIDGFSLLLESGFTDTFRHFHPNEIKYTYWNYLFNAREKNAGWRIDYVLASEEILPMIKEAHIYNEFMGSDHCPVGVKVLL